MIRWLMQTDADLPAVPPAAWLSPAERERMAGLHIPKRRQEWLLGRWTAKNLARSFLREQSVPEPELYRLEILPRSDGAPELYVETGPLSRAVEGLRISISHSSGVAFCALNAGADLVGADVERVEPRHPAFAGDYFTPAELHQIAGAPAERRDVLITAIWSAKEAALKALCLGLTVDTRRVECLLDAQRRDDWAPFTVNLDPALHAARPLHGWWREQRGFVLTLATSG
jgi:4'-phosphopantetheinyl transferase